MEKKKKKWYKWKLRAIWDIGNSSGGKSCTNESLGGNMKHWQNFEEKSGTNESWGTIWDIGNNLGEKSDTSKS